MVVSVTIETQCKFVCYRLQIDELRECLNSTMFHILKKEKSFSICLCALLASFKFTNSYVRRSHFEMFFIYGLNSSVNAISI